MVTAMAVLLVVSGTSTLEVIHDIRHGDATWSRTVVIPAAEFADVRVLELAREFDKKAADQYRSAELSIFADRSDVHVMSGKSSLPVTYESWAREYAMFGRRELPMAEVLVLKAGTVVRISDGRRERKRVVLHGVDPLLLRSSGINGEIINVRLYKGIPLDSDQPIRERSGADVCVRTQATLNEETGEAIAREAASAIGLPFAYVHIRNDVWFIHQAFFPIDYRFEEAAPPSYSEYRESATLTCFVEAGESTCTLHRPPR